LGSIFVTFMTNIGRPWGLRPPETSDNRPGAASADDGDALTISKRWIRFLPVLILLPLSQEAYNRSGWFGLFWLFAFCFVTFIAAQEGVSRRFLVIDKAGLWTPTLSADPVPWSDIEACACNNEPNRWILQISLRPGARLSATSRRRFALGSFDLNAAQNKLFGSRVVAYCNIDFRSAQTPQISLDKAFRACAARIGAAQGRDDMDSPVRPFVSKRPPMTPAQMRVVILSIVLAFVVWAPLAIYLRHAASVQAEAENQCFKGRGDSKIAACTRVIEAGARRHGNLAWAYNNRGNAYHDQKGDLDRAFADYDQAIRLDRNYTFAYSGRGNVYRDKGDLDRALADYNAAIRLDPKSVYPYQGRGNVYWGKGDLDAALAEYEHAIRLDPNLSIAYDGRGVVYRDKGDLDRAIGAFSEAIRLDPTNVYALGHRGYIYRDNGDFDRALADLDAAIRLDPKNVYAHYGLGGVYWGKREFERAFAEFDQTLRLDPRATNAYVGRGNYYLEIKHDFDRAFADYDEAVRRDPNSASGHGARATAYRNRGDLDHALTEYDEALRLDPKNGYALSGRGFVFRSQGEKDRALADFEQAIRLNPKFAYAYAGRGDVLIDSGDFDRALADFDAAIRLDPSYAYAHTRRGNLYRDRGDLDRALADADAAIQLAPDDAAGYLGRGLAQIYRGETAEALAAFDRASALAPADAYFVIWREIAAQRSGQPSTLEHAIAGIDMNKWPAPVLRMLQGQMSSDAVLGAVDDADPIKRTGQLCEANLYVGEQALQIGARDEADSRFKAAAKACPLDFIEWSAANLELKALGAAP
jgi:tetratricopeptide (TPR) repeat protein